MQKSRKLGGFRQLRVSRGHWKYHHPNQAYTKYKHLLTFRVRH